MKHDEDELSWSRWFGRWLLKAPDRWLGRRSPVAQDVGGTRDGFKYLRNLVRGNRVPKRNSPSTTGKKEDIPVLLIHGFMGTRGSMFPLEERLLNDGYIVFSFNLGAINTNDVRTSAFKIHRKIEMILAQTKVKEIDIVGHSMGGLIGLYYAKKLGGHEHIRKLILMGTPVHGTWTALLGVATVGLFSSSSWQLLPRSRFLDELHQGPLPKNLSVYSFAAARDWVAPVSSTKLKGATSIVVPMGHSSLIISNDVYKRLQTILKSSDAKHHTKAEDSSTNE